MHSTRIRLAKPEQHGEPMRPFTLKLPRSTYLRLAYLAALRSEGPSTTLRHLLEATIEAAIVAQEQDDNDDAGELLPPAGYPPGSELEFRAQIAREAERLSGEWIKS